MTENRLKGNCLRAGIPGFVGLLAAVILSTVGGTPVLLSVDLDCPSVGATMTFQGTGLANTTAVSLIWTRFEAPAGFTAMSDTTPGVVFTEPRQANHNLLMQTPTGSVVTLPYGLIQ